MLLLLAACANDVSYAPTSRVLDSWSYVDAGVLAEDDRQVFTVPLFSRGAAPVTVFHIEASEVSSPNGSSAPAFLVDPAAWGAVGCDRDGDGSPDCRELGAYDDDSDDDTLALPVVFAPTAIGEYEGLLTVWSNDSQSTVKEPLPGVDGESRAIWRIQLRGRADVPCGRVWPRFLDFGPRAVGGEFRDTLRVDNCGPVRLVISAVHVDAIDMYATTVFPLYVLPGSSEDISVSWVVPAATDGQPTPLDAEITIVSNGTDVDAVSTSVIGNTCAASVLQAWDADADGWSTCGGDCDDHDPTINPSEVERARTGEDEDCDGEIDEAANPVASDDDLDGWSELEGDCDDADAALFPGAPEVENGVDDNCDGVIDEGTIRVDDDGDGWSEREGDCDDANRLVSPDRDETVDGVDNDCDGVVDEGGVDVDDDGDGLTERDGDCDDRDPWVRPGAREYCDGYDNDCDRTIDEGDDDTPDGACAFLPERDEEDEEGGAVARGCAAVPGAGSLPLLLLGAALIRRRVRA